jgi:hypothetical protein
MPTRLRILYKLMGENESPPMVASAGLETWINAHDGLCSFWWNTVIRLRRRLVILAHQLDVKNIGFLYGPNG